MTEEEIDRAASLLVHACGEAGIPSAFVRDLPGDDFRLICPDSLVIRPLLAKASECLREREELHRC
jgi:hypothetical protein